MNTDFTQNYNQYTFSTNSRRNNKYFEIDEFNEILEHLITSGYYIIAATSEEITYTNFSDKNETLFPTGETLDNLTGEVHREED